MAFDEVVLGINAVLATPMLIGLTAWRRHRFPKLYAAGLLSACAMCAVYVAAPLIPYSSFSKGLVSYSMVALWCTGMLLYAIAMVRGWGTNTFRMYVPCFPFALIFFVYTTIAIFGLGK